MTKLQDFLNSEVPNVAAMRVPGRAGDLFGVELECEGKRVDWDGDNNALLKDWTPNRDGSLRDHHGSCCEWVCNGPVKYEAAVKRVKTLFDYFTKRGAKLVTSNRTSTHVHFNMADKNAYQVINLFILFTIFEDLLDRYCGEDRRGNLFCLSSRHANQQVRWIEQACFDHFQFGHLQEGFRYCSLNVAAINKFGTVEFRGMRGLDNEQDVLDWLGILNEFCQYACYTMKNPVKIVEDISVKTPMGFLREVFNKKNVELLTAGLNEAEIGESIYEGLRLVQMLVYRVGTEFDQVRLRGKDFWASFNDKEDQEPVLDIDPEEFVAGGGPKPLRGGRARAAAPPPLNPNPYNNPGLAELVERERARIRAARDVWQVEPGRWGEPAVPQQARKPLRGGAQKVKVVQPARFFNDDGELA